MGKPEPDSYEGGSILLAEDDPGHARLIQKNLRRHGLDLPLEWFQNGKDLLDFIQRAHQSIPEGARSLVLILDLNMPVKDGFEVLKELRASRSLDAIPTLVLTTSSNVEDEQQCRSLGCRGFFTKPADYATLVDAVRSLLFRSHAEGI